MSGFRLRPRRLDATLSSSRHNRDDTPLKHLVFLDYVRLEMQGLR